MDSQIWTAFFIGLLSAASLPLGTLTSFVWRPGDRALAFLMAFGGGALLAALTVDLVAPAVEHGHTPSIAAGCLLGSLLFIVLNQVVNNKGGFLRKLSTTVYHMRREADRKCRKALHQLGRIDVFQDLPERQVREFAAAAATRDYPPGMRLYREGDPCDHLYIVDEGAVELHDPRDGMRAFARLGRNDAFARMAFFTGSPHATAAETTTETRVWMIPRYALERMIIHCPAFAVAMERLLRGDEVATYLRQRHGLDDAAIDRWRALAIDHLRRGNPIPAAVETPRHDEQFCHAMQDISRAPFLRGLPTDVIERVAARAVWKTHEAGHTFFHQGERADRMYLIDEGRVALIDPKKQERRPDELRTHDVFGHMSFLTHAQHSATAVASTPAAVWVLRRRDFDALLGECPELEASVKAFLAEEQVGAYLREKQRFDPEKAASWTRSAIRGLEMGRGVPSVAEMTQSIGQQHGAPLAIWLGILLDGVPESFAIGASISASSSVSLSLLAGLFLSNYPESLSSSVGMRHLGMSSPRILGMWLSLMLATGIGAAVGNVTLAGAPPHLSAIIEGIAAGAMLTMIAETMLPEAYLKGRSIIGFSTVLGFLAAIGSKAFE